MNEKKPHHRKDGFVNPYPTYKEHNFSDFLKWRWNRGSELEKVIDPKNYKFSYVENNAEEIRKNTNKFSVTWIGHATSLIQLDGKNILTDPIWSERCSPLSFVGPKRYVKPGIEMKNLPRIHFVLISHNHYDHMDLPSLKELNKRFSPTFIVGLKNKQFLESNGIQNVIELDWWDHVFRDGLRIHFTPTQHFSARGLLDRNETLWGSFIIEGQENTFYFAGDTAYFPGFKEIAEKFPRIDLAILPIGAYEPRWFMSPVHMDPAGAVLAFMDLKAKYLLPMHYQTFVLTDEPLDEPLKLCKKEYEAKQLPPNHLLPLKIGETYFFR
ncbi:MAG: MBL fold metallo-hydrolase [Leptospiraceae bacterium]|nr:MBL fold metallo-hydrolase [Leptospiraceae bacterium]